MAPVLERGSVMTGSGSGEGDGSLGSRERRWLFLVTVRWIDFDFLSFILMGMFVCVK